MRIILLATFFLCFCSLTFGQLISNGKPFTLYKKSFKNVVTLNHISNNDLEKKYPSVDISKSFHFGEEINYSLNLLDYESEKLSDEGIIYTVELVSQEALSLNLIFSQFELKKGSLMYLFNPITNKFSGAYSFLNNNVEKVLGTDIVEGNRLVIELYEPKENIGTSLVKLGTIVHGFRNVNQTFAKAFGGSGSCNYDVNCPLGVDYVNQKNGVGVTISGGSACTGSLVNTTDSEIKPYYLTARHCGTSPTNWVIRFNWEREASNTICAATNSTANNGETSHIITGGFMLATSNNADFSLIKLNNLPDPAWNVFYNGWDHSDVENVIGARVIHHPKQDIKKISMSDANPYKTSLAFNGASDCQVWRVDQWNSGTTEQGSSGSPLFDQNKRIIGVLTGGTASCSGTVPNSGYDVFGRFGYAWQTLSDSSQQLKYWLDPNNTNTTYIDGRYQSDSSLYTDLSFAPFSWLDNPNLCDRFDPFLILYNSGTEIIQSAKIIYRFNSVYDTILWSGNLSRYQTDTLWLNFPNLTGGSVLFSASIITINGGMDAVQANNFFQSNFQYSEVDEWINLKLNYDFYTSETQWKLVDQANESMIYAQNSFTTNGISPADLSICLPVGCYRLKISDSGNDGWSSMEYPSGFVLIRNSEGLVLNELNSSNANFGSEIDLDFCLNSVSLSVLNQADFSIYPNPTNGLVTIQSLNSQLIENITIYSLNGSIVQTISDLNTLKCSFQANLSPGVYLVQLNSSQHIQNFKLVVE